ncbi:hypothetical protein [Roseisolibacter agri]|nr:hypothetical protein [Roseisolibacter agri]
MATPFRHVLGAAALVLAGAGVANAQATGADPRWRAWLGCWSPVDASGVVPMNAPLNCVVPATGGTGVEVLTVADGKVASRDRLDATAARQPRQIDGCDGWEQAQWSADGRRLHLRSAATCAGGVTRASSGILAFAPDGDWLEVRSASVGTGAGVRVTRFRPAPASSALPADVAAALSASRRDEEVRLALGAPITTEEVADAVRLSDAPVVEAWLAARGQGFALDARRLARLADRGVPERVIDVMVALSYPKVFALNPATGDQERRTLASSDARLPGQTVGPSVWLYGSPFGYGAYGWNAYNNGYYRNGYYGGYYGNGFYGSGWFPGSVPVVVVVRDPNAAPTERARAVNGRGYTRGGSSGSATPGATPRATTRSGSSSGGSSGSSGGSQSSGGSSSGSSSSGSGRTAKPRP